MEELAILLQQKSLNTQDLEEFLKTHEIDFTDYGSDIAKIIVTYQSAEFLTQLLDKGMPREKQVLLDLCLAKNTDAVGMLLNNGWDPLWVEGTTASSSCPEIQELLAKHNDIFDTQ